MSKTDLFGNELEEKPVKESEDFKSAIKRTRKEALDKIVKYLSHADIERQFDNISGGYYSSDKFLVTWNGYWKTIPSEFKIEKCDQAYTAYCGAVCVHGHASLFHEQQIKSYRLFEQALIEVGYGLCPNAKEKKAWYEKYVVPYNERQKQKINDTKESD